MTHDLTTLVARDPADLIALVPGCFGFHPEQSVVMLSVGGGGQPCHARVDLPADRSHHAPICEQLGEVARRNGANALVFLLYTDDAPRAGAFAGVVRHCLAEGRPPVVGIFRVDDARWWRLDGPSRDDDPGTPYDLSVHPFTAHTVVEGTVVLGSREELAESLATDPAEARRVAQRAAQRATRRVPNRSARVAEGRWVQRRVRRFLTDGRALTTSEVARLTLDLGIDLEIRDVAWAEMDRDNARRHVDLWRDVVRRSPDHLVAAPAALLGFAAWLSGNGALAWCAVDRCQAASPGYSLAGLLTQALAGGLPPSAWTPLPRSVLTLFDDARSWAGPC
jgi:hypothetical protein